MEQSTGREFVVLAELILSPEFFDRKIAEKIFDEAEPEKSLFLEFWVLYQKAKNASKEPIILAEEVSSLSHSVSIFYDISDEIFSKTESSEIAKTILKVIWLYTHSTMRFGAGYKVSSLNLLSSVVEGLGEVCKEVIKFFFTKVGNERNIDESKLRALARLFFDLGLSKVKRLRGELPTSHFHKTLFVDLQGFDWEMFLHVREKINEVLEFQIEVCKFLRESFENQIDCRILEQIRDSFSKSFCENTRKLGQVLRKIIDCYRAQQTPSQLSRIP